MITSRGFFRLVFCCCFDVLAIAFECPLGVPREIRVRSREMFVPSTQAHEAVGSSWSGLRGVEWANLQDAWARVFAAFGSKEEYIGPMKVLWIY